MKIEGPIPRGKEQVAIELRQGAKFVTFQYCISVLVLTFRRSSSIVYIRQVRARDRRGSPSPLSPFSSGGGAYRGGQSGRCQQL